MSIQRKNNDFSVTSTLHDFIRNYDWRQGFDEVLNNELPRLADGRVDLDACPGFASLWLTLSASFEPEVAQIYERIANMVPSNSDVETCTMHALHSIAQSIGVKNFHQLDLGYPLEIKELLDIFSISPEKLVHNKILSPTSTIDVLSGSLGYGIAMDGYLVGFVNVSGTAWSPLQGTSAISYHTSSVWTDDQTTFIQNAQVGFHPRINDPAFLSLMEDTFYRTLSTNVTLDRIIDDMYNSIYVDFSRDSATVLNPPEDSATIDAKKAEYNVPLTFFANAELDSIIAGRTNYYDYTTEEKIVLDALVKERAEVTQVNDQFVKYRYEKERRVREYIKFIEDISTVSTPTVSAISPGYDEIVSDGIRFFDNDANGVPVSGTMLQNATYFLRNAALSIYYQRENLKTILQKHSLIGTERLIATLIEEYILRNFVNYDQRRYRNIPALSSVNPAMVSGLTINANVGTTINVVEYLDITEYMNLSARVDKPDVGNTRYWEDPANIEISENSIVEVSSFYSRLPGLERTPYDAQKSFLDFVYGNGALSAHMHEAISAIVDYNDFQNEDIAASVTLTSAGVTGTFTGTLSTTFGGNLVGYLSGYPNTQLDGTINGLVSGYAAGTLAGTYAGDAATYSYPINLYMSHSLSYAVSGAEFNDYRNTITSSVSGSLSGAILQSTTDVYVSGDLDPMWRSLSGVYFKYWGTPSGTIGWANYKNADYPTVAHIPYLYNLLELIRHQDILDSIYSYQTYSFDNSLSSKYDAEGNTIDFWRKENETFTPYRDVYQYATNENQAGTSVENIDHCGPFYFPALSAYLDSASNFIANSAEWYGHLTLESEDQQRIVYQLQGYESDIDRLANKRIYQYDIDTFGNEYTLFKDDDKFDTSGEVWVKYNDHPLSFPLTAEGELSGQIDTQTEWNGIIYDDMYRCFDMGVVSLYDTNVVWLYCSDGSEEGNKTGRIYFFDIQYKPNQQNKFVAVNLKGATSDFTLVNENETFIGVYQVTGRYGPAFVYVTLLSKEETVDGYVFKFRFKGYDETFGWTQRELQVTSIYDVYEGGDHNPWKLTNSSELLTITFESALPTNPTSAVFLGSGARGYYGGEWNEFKHGYHNGVTTIDLSLEGEITYPTGYEIDYYMGYNDVSYQSVQAWEGWQGGNGIPDGIISNYMDDTLKAKISYLGESDPATSARFDIGSIEMLCTNYNNEDFGILSNNVLPYWGIAEQTWADTYRQWTKLESIWKFSRFSSDPDTYFAWKDSTSDYHRFTYPGETWRLVTVDERDTLYQVTVTYEGPGCQKIVVEFDNTNSQLLQSPNPPNIYWIRAQHLAEVLTNDGTTMTVNMLQEEAAFQIGEVVRVVDESDSGPSTLIVLTIDPVAGEATEDVELATITAKADTLLTLTGDDLSEFSVGKTVTITEKYVHPGT
jgi:hypothetical protein